jgi:hypothetical protein
MQVDPHDRSGPWLQETLGRAPWRGPGAGRLGRAAAHDLGVRGAGWRAAALRVDRQRVPELEGSGWRNALAGLLEWFEETGATSTAPWRACAS